MEKKCKKEKCSFGISDFLEEISSLWTLWEKVRVG